MSLDNIWIATADGNFERVKELIESGISGSIYDDNLYTPIHAASSYSQVEILKYLIEKGQGNINIIDFEGETALFYAETITIIQLILTLGGNPLHENHLGQTAAQTLQSDYPHLSLYLSSITGQPFIPTISSSTTTTTPWEDDTTISPDLETPTNDLLVKVGILMQSLERGELSIIELDEQLRQLVQHSVESQFTLGRSLVQQHNTTTTLSVIRERQDSTQDASGKRRRE